LSVPVALRFRTAPVRRIAGVYSWLTDSSTWDHSAPVGDIAEHDVEGLVIDATFFDAASVTT